LTGFHGFQDYAAWRHWLDKNRGTLPPQLPMEEEPADAEGYYRRGRRRWDRKEFDPAIEDFTKAVELDPKHADSWASRGTLRAWKKEDHSGGLADIEKALSLEPDNVNILRGAGWVRFIAGDAPGALKALSRAIELNPRDPHLWWARAGYRRRIDDRDGAIEDTRRALDLGGANWDRRSSAELFLKELGADPYDPRVPKICDVCKKRPSIVHDTRIEHGKPVEMHYCAACRSVMPK
jgi:tetratricopeptide (TPR) repeat protein